MEKDDDIERLRGELDAARSRVAEREAEVAALRKELRVSRSLLAEKDAAVEALYGSFSWRITAPIRLARKLAVRLFRPRAWSKTIGTPVDAGEMVAAAPRVCIFAHYDRSSIVSDYVFELLRGISSAGYSILFVSTAKRISEPDRERLEPLCTGLYLRENKGRDLGSWQFGLARLKNLERLDWLLLANDSVFGPFFDLGNMAGAMERTDADFWGVTDCYQGKWHLQSYFLCLGGAVVRSETFRDFFARDFAGLTKRELIDLGEIGLSQALIGAGYQGAAYCPYDALDGGKREFSRNPLHHYWDKLITEARCPFVKIELLRDNPFEIPDVDRFREVVSAASGYELDLIEAYLDRTGAARKTTPPRKTP